MFGYFLALRTVTQRPLQYFLEQRDMLEAFMDLEEPSEVEQELVYRDQDYRNLMNLVTHLHDTPESLSLKNCVIAVFFLRFLQVSCDWLRAGHVTQSSCLIGSRSTASTSTRWCPSGATLTAASTRPRCSYCGSCTTS